MEVRQCERRIFEDDMQHGGDDDDDDFQIAKSASFSRVRLTCAARDEREEARRTCVATFDQIMGAKCPQAEIRAGGGQ